MTGEFAQQIGGLQVQAKTAEKNVDTLFNSNEKRKVEQAKTTMAINSLQNLVSETNHANEGLVSAMESLERSVKKIDETVDKVNTQVVVLGGKVAALEGRLFNWQKFLSAIGSKPGLYIITIICLTLTIVSLAILAPETLPQFFDVVGAKAKG